MGAEGDSRVGTGGDEQVNVNIRCTGSSKYSVKTNLRSTVEEFKALLAHHCDVPVEKQRLIYKGRILKDDQTLISYGLQADHSVHMFRGSAPVATPPLPVLPATQVGLPPFVGLGTGGSPGLFGGRLPEFEQMQQQLSQNPNMLRDLMNMPAIQNTMNNPEILRSMIMSNPQMRDIVDRNPELGHVLNDPSILQQTMETARNPALMREMMRNTDRAMSNIESSPEGFNMLRRMYENVQEPLLNATTVGGAAATDAGTNPFAALLGNQSGTHTRSGCNSSTAGPEVTTGTTVPNSNPLPNPWNSSGGSQTNNSTMQNPDIIRELSSPATMQQMMAGQHLSQLSRQQSSLEGSQIGQDRAAGTPNNMGLGLLMNMFGGLGAGGLTAPNASNVPPEEQYATQLSQLQEMGFFDTLENIRALRATSGNVHAAVERLLGNPGQ